MNILNYSIYYNCRLNSRTDIVKEQYKKVIIHSLIFVSLNFIICLLFFHKVYNFLSINSLSYYICLAIIHILGYILISGLILLFNQINRFNSTNIFIFVYIFFIFENFLIYETILSKKIPIIISWVFSDNNVLIRIGILYIINIVLYNTVLDKCLGKDWI